VQYLPRLKAHKKRATLISKLNFPRLLKVRFFANNTICTSTFLQQQQQLEQEEAPPAPPVASNAVSIFDIGIPTFAGLDTVAITKLILTDIRRNLTQSEQVSIPYVAECIANAIINKDKLVKECS